MANAAGPSIRAPASFPIPSSARSELREFYVKARPDYSGRVTVPVLWDKTTNTIVSNESSEIIRMFNSAFDGIGAAEGDYYPSGLRPEIDEVNDRIYRTVNNGVYRAGFATTQAAYEEAFRALFDTLDWLEARLASQRFLIGQRLTEADWRLFTTLIRFDAVYFGHFKCNLREIRDYPGLSRYLKELYHCRASPRRSTSFISSITITRAICASTRPGSCRGGPNSRCEDRGSRAERSEGVEWAATRPTIDFHVTVDAFASLRERP